MNRRKFISFLSFSALYSSSRLSWRSDLYHINSMSELRNFKPEYIGQEVYLESYYVGVGRGGGYFTFHEGVRNDNGGTVISAVGGGYWLRSLHNDLCLVYDFGARDDIDGFDSTNAIQGAIDNCNHISLGGGHFNISHPLYLRSNIIFDGDFGSLSSLAPKNSAFMQGSIFAPGNYHPDFLQKIIKKQILDCKDNSIKLDDVSGFRKGDIVRISSHESTLSFGFWVENYIQLSRIIKVDSLNKTLIIEHPISFHGELELCLASTNSVKARFGRPLFCCSDTIVRNTEVNTWDYWIADSCTYNMLFENIYGSAKSVVYGNSYCYTTFKNIRIKFTGSVSELAFGSHFTTLEGIYAISSNDGVSKKEMISWTEAGRNCTLSRFLLRINNNETPSTIIRISGHSNAIIRNGQIFIFSNPNNILSVENYGNGQPECVNITYSNIDVYAKESINVFCDVFKANDTAAIEKVSFHNVRYFGMKPKVALLRLRGTPLNTISGVDAIIYSKYGGDAKIAHAKENYIHLASVAYESTTEDFSTNNVTYSKVN